MSWLALLLASLAIDVPARAPATPPSPPRSAALGAPTDGRLRDGVLLSHRADELRTWDPIERTSPSRPWRRHGTDRLVRVLRRVAREHARAHPDAPPMVVGDLSRPRGGDFGARYGIVGHASHQNGLDADVYYPRADGRAEPPASLAGADWTLSRALVRRFARAGATLIYVSPGLGLTGGALEPVGGHEDHLHVRIRSAAPPDRARTP